LFERFWLSLYFGSAALSFDYCRLTKETEPAAGLIETGQKTGVTCEAVIKFFLISVAGLGACFVSGAQHFERQQEKERKSATFRQQGLTARECTAFVNEGESVGFAQSQIER